jgi:hypothetical protein
MNFQAVNDEEGRPAFVLINLKTGEAHGTFRPLTTEQIEERAAMERQRRQRREALIGLCLSAVSVPLAVFAVWLAVTSR